MLQMDVSVVICDAGFNGTAGLPNVDLTMVSGSSVFSSGELSSMILSQDRDSGCNYASGLLPLLVASYRWLCSKVFYLPHFTFNPMYQ
jgi:hypothetical protein